MAKRSLQKTCTGDLSLPCSVISGGSAAISTVSGARPRMLRPIVNGMIERAAAASSEVAMNSSWQDRNGQRVEIRLVRPAASSAPNAYWAVSQPGRELNAEPEN